jgi:hypothetical protein
MIRADLRSCCRLLVSLWIAGGIVLASSQVRADLMLDISGVPGSGETTWVFSGSSITTGLWGFGGSTSQQYIPSADLTTTTIALRFGFERRLSEASCRLSAALRRSFWTFLSPVTALTVPLPLPVARP